MESVITLLREVDDPIKLGKELCIDDETLQEIKENGGSGEQLMTEVIDTWMKESISWRTLASAVERIGYHQSAQEIRRMELKQLENAISQASAQCELENANFTSNTD